MKNIFLLPIALLGIILLSVSGCSNSSSSVSADLGAQFRLPIGKSAAINGQSLSIKFQQVTADSRCPTGVQCIWAGEAKCQTTVTLNGTSSPLELTISGSSDSSTTFESYTFTANLEPYPQAGNTIDADNYVLVLKVTK